ncbi:MAG: CDP-diacylglycerol--glycerol-3-phosphate 3-phosphatidyltransferase [Clostridia bacterium]|nr:CDP-diacylglycerol--glycerol-3-phosphate 3-phosphatidyltransferase [Clostridia bacterium]
MKRHLPNIITVLRLFAIPFFIYFMLEDRLFISALIYFTAAVSDLLDGYLARKWKVVSNFGKLADPLADKAIQIAALLLFCILGRLHFAFIIVLFIKESLMILGSYLLYKKKIVVYALWYGKAATLLLNSAITWILLLDLQIRPVNIIIGISMFMELLALALYTKRYFELKKQKAQESENPG